jgi:hypothetical protein
MNRRNILTALMGLFAAPALALLPAHAANDRLSGPFSHGNLSIYLVHGPSASGPVPLTLAEALDSKAVEVIETSDVNNLKIRNIGRHPVFIQSGDIVKGGQQDRVLTVSLVLPPRSKTYDIASFCVEQGRWTARGKEDVTKFSSSNAAMPSREVKLAMKAEKLKPVAGEANQGTGEIAADDIGTRQQKVWEGVKKTQDKLAGSLKEKVVSDTSETSLQLALENAALDKRRKEFSAALTEAALKQDDVIGFAFAVNGTMNSADIYASNGLFRKLWPKLLDAAITEAITESEATSGKEPDVAAAEAFLATAESGKGKVKSLVAANSQEKRENDTAVYVETRLRDAGTVHKSYLMK